MKLTAQGVLAFLANASNTGKSASALTAFAKGVKNNPLSLDLALSAKLKNVLDGVTAVQLNGLVQGRSISLIAVAIKEIKSGKGVSIETLEGVQALPKSKVLEASEVYQHLTGGLTSEGVKALIGQGREAALKSAAKMEQDAHKARLDAIPAPSVSTDGDTLATFCEAVLTASQGVKEAVKTASQEWEDDVLPLFSAFDALNVAADFDALGVIRAAAATLNNEGLQALIVEFSLILELRAVKAA
jgi:hypothetical protein